MDPWGYKIDHVHNAFDPQRIEHPISVVTHHDDGTPLTIAEQKERQRIHLLPAAKDTHVYTEHDRIHSYKGC